jgi:hypothetical protein
MNTQATQSVDWMDGIVKLLFRKQKTPLFYQKYIQNTDYQILTK